MPKPIEYSKGFFDLILGDLWKKGIFTLSLNNNKMRGGVLGLEMYKYILLYQREREYYSTNVSILNILSYSNWNLF